MAAIPRRLKMPGRQLRTLSRVAVIAAHHFCRIARHRILHLERQQIVVALRSLMQEYSDGRQERPSVAQVRSGVSR